MNINCLVSELEKNGIKYISDYDLKNMGSFKIGGVCALAVFPDSAEQLAMAVKLTDGAGLPLCVVGKASNTLFFDGVIDSVLIFTAGACRMSVEGTQVHVEAGVSFMRLCATLADEGLCGAEFACGIPGSIGGAAYMNAGAHGGSFSDIVKYTTAYDRATKRIIKISDHGFGYRKSIYMENRQLVCLSACLELSLGAPEEIKERMRELLAKRRSSQPLEYPSAGSYFKRPEGDFAGRLIEVCGLKGARVGGAMISEKHAGFLINAGGATFDEVMELEALVRERVFAEQGVMLEREVEIIK